MFSKLVIFAFSFILIFAVVLTPMPNEYVQASYEAWEGEYQTDKEAEEVFDAHDLIMYDNAASFNLTYQQSHTETLGMVGDHKIEFWWELETGRKMFEVRHIWPGPYGWWTESERLSITQRYIDIGELPPKALGLEKQHLENLWGSAGGNGSYCEWYRGAGGIYVNTFIFPYNETWSIGESWDNNNLTVYCSYGVDWNATGLSAFNILANLLFFQSPNLGIPGLAGNILNSILSGVLWIMIIVVVVKVILGLVPFGSGVDE